ncbi:cytochrome P450 3A2-like [Protopterus annectens]|uniref:cytochrome P450 3A2-like n=1 Tax=Protopterus annectens TaxID=7888 RepID=UPI001CFAA6E9|nr:cytochrome P450 3A2-like [Protopterus annectens]
MSLSAETWTLIATFILLLLIYGVWPYGFFRKLNIPGPQPLPFIGTLLSYRRGWYRFDMECYQKYGNIWGIYDGRLPLLCVMDTEMLKTILIKECLSLFTNRRKYDLKRSMDGSILVVKDEQWKKVRTAMAPGFSSGNLKEMFSIVKHYGHSMVQYLQKKADTNEPVNVKQMFRAYSLDIIGSASFSVNLNTLNNPGSTFEKHVDLLTAFTVLHPAYLISVLFPIIAPFLEALGYNILPKETVKYFTQIVKSFMDKQKEDKKVECVDFLQMLVTYRAGINSLKHNKDDQPYRDLTDEEIVAQAAVLLEGGYGTSSTSLAFLAYNLATHPDIQRMLQMEIDEAFPDNAPVTYDILMKMKYLDMVINESLRMYPPFGRMDRVCKKTVEIKGIVIPKDTVVLIPIYALHHDPKHWPEPEEFRPERFGEENKKSINPFAYLPFGAGPRNCIGFRFAQVSLKAAITGILQRFSFVPCKETKIPLELDTGFLLQTKEPVVLRVVPRCNVAMHD